VNVVAEAIIYQMMYMKWIAKERKKKNSGLKREGGGRKKTRELSLPWILGLWCQLAGSKDLSCLVEGTTSC
jgi:hypothetical protein